MIPTRSQLTKRLPALGLAWVMSCAFMAGPMHAQEAVDHVVIVLDASGSMAKNMKGTSIPKMEAAKDALKQVLQQLPPTTHVGLVVFGARGLKDPWVIPLGPRNDQELIPAIDAIRHQGGTPLGEFIKKGADRLLEARAAQFGYGTYRLLVVTDGEANDRQLVDRYTPEVIARGITVDVIGVDMNQRHTLATLVHSYRSANDPDSLRQAIADVFAELGGVASDAAGEDAFEVIAGLPLETARAALQALAVSGNEPIGGRRIAEPPVTTPRSPAAPVGGPVPAPQPEPSRHNPVFRVLFFAVIFGVFILIRIARHISQR